MDPLLQKTRIFGTEPHKITRLATKKCFLGPKKTCCYTSSPKIIFWSLVLQFPRLSVTRVLLKFFMLSLRIFSEKEGKWAMVY